MPSFLHPIRTIFCIFLDALTFIRLCFRPTTTVAAENLFRRKQLGLFIERKAKPRRATDASRFTLSRLSCLVDWRNALSIVRPDTLIRWHRQGFHLFWKLKSRPCGRYPRPVAEAHCRDGNEQSNLGEERIADELLLKIGIRIPRTVRRYMPKPPQRPVDPRQRWMTFVRNHAKAIIACDFFVVVTADIPAYYVFLIVEVGTRRLSFISMSRTTRRPIGRYSSFENALRAMNGTWSAKITSGSLNRMRSAL